nr:ATP-binding protein [Micromonospora sp. DSM 115978]
MKYSGKLLARRVQGEVIEALSDTRVVVLNGARQVGKSTLAELVLRARGGGAARFLDDAVTRQAAHADPTAFVRHDGLLFIDEVQRVPDLWLAIKHEVDRDPRPGRFLLTGSARLLALRALPDALVGRAETVELWPLSQGEIDGEPDGFVDAIFDWEDAHRESVSSGLRKHDYLDRVARGGYPEAVSRANPARRRRFFEAYLSDLIVRDVQQVANISRITELRQLLSLLAGQAAGLLKPERLANELGLSAKTISHYLEILETIFVIRAIPAWMSSATSRVVAKPKVIFADSGLANHLAGTLAATRSAAVGGLLENFVLSEIARQLTWSQVQAQLFHYRDRDQREVDGILETYDGRVAGIEVKAAETVRNEDFRSLRHLHDRLGDRFVGGYVLYCGEHPLSFGPKMLALPISALWLAGR